MHEKGRLLWKNGEGMSIRQFSGGEARAYAGEISRIRRAVFRHFPYLYAGSDEFENEHLESYFEHPETVVSLIFDNGHVGGECIDLPLRCQREILVNATTPSRVDVDKYVYLGECILEPDYRRKKLMPVILKDIYDRAKKRGCTHACAIAVCRGDDDPQKPEGYSPFGVWMTKNGYDKVDGWVVEMEWPMMPDGVPRKHALQFWETSLK